MKELYLLLGTNLQDRESNIKTALEALDKAFCGRRLRITDIIETEACGFSGPAFLNAVVVYSSARKPQTILKICKRIERSMGRKDAPEYNAAGERVYHDRIIDIDILLYGDLKLSTPELTIPHPQVYEREFAGVLLKEAGAKI
ncbi:MAG: 2-amino-4-hydroxy-6-hydroxymethyldihydropteridine diphosphokinase [Bacteroidales bacterium]|nr:2-amino-4-hydroxy-6-hydroxymethyldihydropteridine diphosphokinase [Bacteroidales bacterium]